MICLCRQFHLEQLRVGSNYVFRCGTHGKAVDNSGYGDQFVITSFVETREDYPTSRVSSISESV